MTFSPIRTALRFRVTKRERLPSISLARYNVSEQQRNRVKAKRENNEEGVNHIIDTRLKSAETHLAAIYKVVHPMYDYKSHGEYSPNKKFTKGDCQVVRDMLYETFNSSNPVETYNKRKSTYYRVNTTCFYKSAGKLSSVQQDFMITEAYDLARQETISFVLDPLIQETFSPLSFWRPGRELLQLATLLCHRVDHEQIPYLVHLEYRVGNFNVLNKYIINKVPGKSHHHYSIIEAIRGRTDSIEGIASKINPRRVSEAQWIPCPKGPTCRITGGVDYTDNMRPRTPILWNTARSELEGVYIYGNVGVIPVSGTEEDVQNVVEAMTQEAHKRGRSVYSTTIHKTMWGLETPSKGTGTTFKFMGYELYDGKHTIQMRKKQYPVVTWSPLVHKLMAGIPPIEVLDNLIKHVCHLSVKPKDALGIMKKKFKPVVKDYKGIIIPYKPVPSRTGKDTTLKWRKKRNKRASEPYTTDICNIIIKEWHENMNRMEKYSDKPTRMVDYREELVKTNPNYYIDKIGNDRTEDNKSL